MCDRGKWGSGVQPRAAAAGSWTVVVLLCGCSSLTSPRNDRSSWGWNLRPGSHVTAPSHVQAEPSANEDDVTAAGATGVAVAVAPVAPTCPSPSSALGTTSVGYHAGRRALQVAPKQSPPRSLL